MSPLQLFDKESTMCEIRQRNLSLTLQPNLQTPDTFHCSVFKNDARIQINCSLVVPYLGGTINIEIPLPEENLDGWKFCVLGFTKENQDAPICQKVRPLSSLIHNSTVVV
ncbi:hypothetical protein [Simkania sp.]|uniref:hypothetical protein n=1 Tax=Simkania sp. TaxID=34094 RepID=UPI003B528E41